MILWQWEQTKKLLLTHHSLVKRSTMIFLQVIFVIVASLPLTSAYQNVYGNALESCSSDGTALTGYTRNGYCVDRNDDAGSHHICINLASANGGNFCTVTGQSDWCSSEDMPCHEDVNDEACAIQNWCVCQWAFASYIAKAGGCDEIQNIQCNAVNIQAIWAYRDAASRKQTYQDALDCLVSRCSLDLSQPLYTVPNKRGNKFGMFSWWVAGVALCVVLTAAFASFKSNASVRKKSESLLQQSSEESTSTRTYKHSSSGGV